MSVMMSAGDGSARQTERPSGAYRSWRAVRNPAQVSFWLLEPAADAAMTYFYAQLFAMDTEIRAMFPAAMDVFPAVSDEPAHDVRYGTVPELAAKATFTDRDIYISGPDHMIVRTVRTLRDGGASGHLIHYDLDPKVVQEL